MMNHTGYGLKIDCVGLKRLGGGGGGGGVWWWWFLVGLLTRLRSVKTCYETTQQCIVHTNHVAHATST